MKALPMIGRIIFSIPFLFLGFGHFAGGQEMTAFLPSWLPAGIFWVYLTGVALVAAGVSIIIKVYARLATQLLALLLLLIILLIWAPQLGAEGQQGMTAMTMLVKDLGLMGAALYMSGQFDGVSGR